MSDEWVETRLGDVVSVNPEKTPKWPVDHEIQYVDIASVSFGSGINFNEVKRVPFGDAPGRARRILRTGDVIVSTVRPNLRAFAQIPSELDGQVASTGFAVLRASEAIEPGFIWAITSTDEFVDFLVGRCTGSNYPAVRADDVCDFKFRLPPLPVQRRIVDLLAHLDNHLANLQTELVSNQCAEFAILGRLATFTGGAKPDSSLSDHSSVFDCEHKTAPAASPTDVVFGYSIGTRDIKNGLLLVSQAKPVTHETWATWSRRVQVQSGDVILSREAPVGSVAVVPPDAPPICLGQRTVLIRPKNGIDGMLLSGILRSPEIQRWMHDESAGLTVAHLNVADIKRLPMNTSDLNAMVGERSSAIGALLDHRETLQRELSSLRSFRNALLTALLSGDHRVPRQYDVFLSEVA